MVNVGITGCGFVGTAFKDWLEQNTPECKVFISDPTKVTMTTLDLKSKYNFNELRLGGE